MGRLAALQVGMTARNLSGATIASEKIILAIIKSSITAALRSKRSYAAGFT